MLQAGDRGLERLGSRYAGVRGNPERPVVALRLRQEGLWLEFHSCRSRDAFVEEGVYVPVPRFDREGGIEISELIYPRVLELTAARVAGARGEPSGMEMQG